MMVWIAVGSKGQDLALNYALFCLYFWLNGFHLSMPGNNSCATKSVLLWLFFSVKTGDIKSCTRIMILFMVSSTWQVSRGSGVNGLTMSLLE